MQLAIKRHSIRFTTISRYIFFNKWVTPQAKTAKVALSQGDPKLTDDGTLRRGVANVLDVLDRYHHRYLS